MIGGVRDLTCRPQNFYSTRRVNAIQHEYWITEFVVQSRWKIQRDQNLKFNCDGIIPLDIGKTGYIEMETGTNIDRFHRKFKYYRDVDGFVLIITLNEEDRLTLQKTCEPIAESCLFHVLGESTWCDIDGNEAPALKPYAYW